MRIKHKLFLLILIANMALAFIMYVLTMRSFSEGFVQYVEETERQKLMPLINELALVYAEESNWKWVNNQHHKWRSLIDKHIGNPRPPLRNQHRPKHRPPPFDLHPPKDKRPPRRPPRSRQTNNLLIINNHIYLKDKQNQLIIGNRKRINIVHWIPIVNADETLGYIGYVKQNILSNHLNTLFVEEQQKNFLLIALSLIFLSALFALPAASLFLRPFNKISKMLTQIAEGDFTKRLKIVSRDEVGDLSKNLNGLAITLEKTLQARQQWIADISHELRTPVAILKGELEAIQDGVRIVTKTTLISLQHEVDRLTRLINDLHELTLADMGALSYQKEALNFAKLIRERVDTQQANFQRCAIHLEVNFPQSPFIMIGDAKRLEQLIDNLLQNSLRYTDKLGILRISLTLKNRVCSLIWEDSSPGVSELDLVKLTEPLYRAEQSRNRNTGGSGLGLAICTKIVEAHQGTISMSHSTLGGLAITITFPI